MTDWLFDPRKDITAYELALLLQAMAAPDEDIRLDEREFQESLPDQLKRHFRPIDQPSQG